MFSSVTKDLCLFQVGDACIVGYFQGVTIYNLIYEAVCCMHNSSNSKTPCFGTVALPDKIY